MPSLVRARAPSLRRDRAMLIYTQRELNWGLFFNKTINSKYGEKQSRPGWAPDPPMVGIRSPIGLVVGSCTSHPGVLGSIPKREEPGKTGAPCVKVPGSSRVPREQLCNSYCSNTKHTHKAESCSEEEEENKRRKRSRNRAPPPRLLRKESSAQGAWGMGRRRRR